MMSIQMLKSQYKLSNRSQEICISGLPVNKAKDHPKFVFLLFEPSIRFLASRDARKVVGRRKLS